MNAEFVAALVAFRDAMLKLTPRDHALLEVRISGDVASLAGLAPGMTVEIYGVLVIADQHVRIDGGVTRAHELSRRARRPLRVEHIPANKVKPEASPACDNPAWCGIACGCK